MRDFWPYTLFAAFFVFMTLFQVANCTDEPEARRVLADEGYSDVRFTGYAWGACSKDDTSHTGFRARAPSGRDVEGVVCCGALLKACTVRH